MTDTITLPSGVEVTNGMVLVVPGIGVVLPLGGLTPAEVADLRDDVAAVMGLELADLPDVDLTGLADGMYLRWDATDSKWEPFAIANGIRVRDAAATILSETAADLTFRLGLTATHSSGRTYVQPVFGASGTADVVARSDHKHPPTLKGRYTFDKGAAVLGTGISSLVNETVTGLVAGITYDVDVTGTLEAVNTNLSGRLILHTRIGAAAAQSRSRGFSGGVWTEASNHGALMSVTGTSLQLQFWAEYASGDPTALYTGELVYSISPRGGTT